MSTLKQQFLTPVGRLVQGHPMEKQNKNMQGQPLMTQAGQPTQRYFCALAFPKNDPAFPAFYAQLDAVARQSFPQLFPNGGACTHPRFSWKLVDGDGVDDNGRSNKEKDGFAGHWVVKFSSSFPPKCFYAGRYEPQNQIQDPNPIRRGYYGRVSGTIEGNNNPQKPGLYVNLSMFELSAQGVEIVSGPDAGDVFGAAAPALPMGATALPGGGMTPQGTPGGYPQPGQVPGYPQPVAGALPVMPVAGALPVMPGQQPAMPTFPGAVPAGPAPVAPGATPMMAVQPNPAFAAGPAVNHPGATPAQMMPVPGMPTPTPPVPAGPQKTAAWPAGFTYEQMIGGGWSDATLRQSGYIV